MKARLKILEQVINERLQGVCPMRSCGHYFSFEGKFIIEETVKNMAACKKLKEERGENRGSCPWNMTFCEKCGKKFGWEVKIYSKGVGKTQDFKFSLITKKALGSFHNSRVKYSKKSK